MTLDPFPWVEKKCPNSSLLIICGIWWRKTGKEWYWTNGNLDSKRSAKRPSLTFFSEIPKVHRKWTSTLTLTVITCIFLCTHLEYTYRADVGENDNKVIFWKTFFALKFTVKFMVVKFAHFQHENHDRVYITQLYGRLPWNGVR